MPEPTCRKRIVAAAVLLALSLALLACGPGPTRSSWQQTVDALAALKPEGTIPDHLQQRNAVKDGSEFDPNRYFSVLTHLSMEPGYVLDYVYYFDGMAGLPMLYARPADQAPYATYDDYAKAVAPAEQRSSYLDHVRADGTPEGFFQLVLLRIAGGQFYLFWHANYDDARVLCDRSGLEALLATMGEADLKLPDDVVAQARAIDLGPVVEFQGDTVRVRVVTFSMWSGFSEETYSLSKESPHSLLDVQTKVLVPYDSGITF